LKSTKTKSKEKTNDLGCITNIEVVNRYVSLPGRLVIDAGCGDMVMSRQFADCGASVLAIDPDPIQAELNRKSGPIENIEFMETGADRISVESQSVDGVFFCYSLHHIPQEIYPQVFEEVLRVLKPDGFLFVIEPMDCPFNDVMKLFHNEDRERAAAWQALEELAVTSFNSAEVVTYHSFAQYESFEHFAMRLASRSFNSLYTEADVRRPEVREAFERIGKPDYLFQSPKQVMILKGPLASGR
jgi:ubiquinone/menaquinone biosynthesis C-methylase UbiE